MPLCRSKRCCVGWLLNSIYCEPPLPCQPFGLPAWMAAHSSLHRFCWSVVMLLVWFPCFAQSCGSGRQALVLLGCMCTSYPWNSEGNREMDCHSSWAKYSLTQNPKNHSTKFRATKNQFRATRSCLIEPCVASGPLQGTQHLKVGAWRKQISMIS